MATKRGVKKAGKAKAPPARSAPRRPARQVSARPAPKKVIAKPTRTHNEPPPVDHNAALGPLFLAAAHGHLTRLVDKAWGEALTKYRQVLSSAIGYELKRSPEARLLFASAQVRQLKLLMGNLMARAQLLLAQHAQEPAVKLVNELTEINKLYGQLVAGLFKGVKFSDNQRAAQHAQLMTEHFSSIARVADLERQAKG